MRRIFASAIVAGLLGFAPAQAATGHGSRPVEVSRAPSSYCQTVHNLHPQVWDDTVCETNDPQGPWVRVTNVGAGGAVAGAYVITGVLAGTGRPDGTPKTGVFGSQSLGVFPPGALVTVYGNVGQWTYVYQTRTHRVSGFDGGVVLSQVGGGGLASVDVYAEEDSVGSSCQDKAGSNVNVLGTPANPQQSTACTAPIPPLQ